MKCKAYVVLEDGGTELGEGYCECWNDRFISIEPTFEKARKKIEELFEKLKADNKEVEIEDEDWNFISTTDFGWPSQSLSFHFQPIEFEVEGR